MFQAKLNINIPRPDGDIHEEVEFSKVENYVIIHSRRGNTNEGTIMHDFKRVGYIYLQYRFSVFKGCKRWYFGHFNLISTKKCNPHPILPTIQVLIRIVKPK